jgi:hypothetical protein
LQDLFQTGSYYMSTLTNCVYAVLQPQSIGYIARRDV